ncbi:HU family DNA-binding protein [Vibrio splendidus]
MKYNHTRRVGPPGEPRIQIKAPFVSIRLTTRKPKQASKHPNWGLSIQIIALCQSPNLPSEVSYFCAGEFIRLFHLICAQLVHHLNLKIVWCHVGSLTCKQRPERQRRNPKSQQLIVLGQSNYVSFKCANKLQLAME